MNNTTLALLWCVLQVTLLAAFVVLWYALLRRTGPAARSLAAFTGLMLILALTAGSLSPWPRWELAARDAPAADLSADPPEVAESVSMPSNGDAADEPAIVNRNNAAPFANRSAATLFWEALTAELRQPATVEEGGDWRWPDILVAIVLAGAVFGLMRLVAGLSFVRRYRAGSRPITDSRLLELRDILQAELSCPCPIELLESDRLSTPATVGWWKPFVLLPVDWSEWNDDERRAVLAHEIAHIQRHDFLTWLTAQVALTLHFYHPLVHWLCGRLRLEQELAADAAAARFAGGRQAYLTTLAAMALRQADRPLAWPARTFLPTRGTFMRRIDMLRDAKPGSTTTSSVGLRVGTVVVLLAAGLFAAGFRGINGPADAADDGRIAGAVAGAATTTADEPASLAYVPRDAVMVAMLRPAKLLKQPAFAQLATAFERMGMSRDEAETLKRIEQVSLVFLLQENPQGQTLPNPSGSILRLADAADAQALAKKLVPNAVEEEYGNHTYFKNPNGGSDGYCYYFVDEKTFLIGKETGIRRLIIAGATGASKAKWAAAWNRHAASGDGALLVNVRGVFAEWDKALRSSTSPNGPVPLLNSFAPLWQNTEVITLAMSSDEDLILLANLLCGSADDAKKVQETVTAVITLAKNSLSQARAAAARVPGKEGADLLGAVDFAGSILDEIRLGRKDGQVEIAARVPARDAATAVSLLVPAVTNARSAARQAQSKNNLRQIGMAMRTYCVKYRKFPPAVLYGPDGKTPYSWRVALLPFLDQANLYQQYRFNEPWDSENNRKVLAQMPPVYRDPNEPGTLTHSSYFVLTGQDTVFSGKEGTEIRQIIDGLSTTFLVIEAQRDIPWTKPEDIPYAADKPLPKFGGHYPDGFQALLCNGSVRFIPAKLNEKTMRSLITKGDGEPIPQKALEPAR